MAAAEGNVLAGLALGIAQRGFSGSDGSQSLYLPKRRGHWLAISAPGLGDAAGGLVGAELVFLAFLVEPGG